ENLTGSAFNDTLTGTTGNNVLTGLAGNDTLNGGTGADTMIGGAGFDRLTGGQDADQFVFKDILESAVGTARDLITDFGVGVDKIDLAGIDAMLGGGDDTFAFIGGAAFSANAGELRYAVSGGQTIIEGDTDGDGIADFQIGLTGVFSLNDFDFIL
ncbi:MAG: M10 family metallopeptidase C-terminal domain-containing protein, partial [Methylocella sp.]